MPGDFTLGCLLGQYNRWQSFDGSSVAISTGVESWDVIGPGTAALNGRAADANAVHSSDQSIRYNVASYGGDRSAFWRLYTPTDDVHARILSDVTTHDLIADIWCRATAGSGLQSNWAFQGATGTSVVSRAIPVGSLPTVDPIRMTQQWYSDGQTNNLRLLVNVKDASSGFSIDVDDVLLRVDPITLLPEFDFLERSRLLAARHRTQGGVLHTYQWTRHFAWQVPLRFLSNSHANLINWWWVNGFALTLTLDTSDAGTIYNVKIVNETQPIGSKIKPYAYALGGWAGVLELESLDQGSLVF